MTNAMISRAQTSFNEADSEEWREALLGAPDVFARVAMHTAADRERAVKLVAARMGADPAVDLRPGLLVQLAFAAADFAESLEAVRSRRWR